MSKEPIMPLYRAHSWSTATAGEPSERQPHLFYRAQDADWLFDKLKEAHKFERRRWKALEKFYLKELVKLRRANEHL